MMKDKQNYTVATYKPTSTTTKIACISIGCPDYTLCNKSQVHKIPKTQDNMFLNRHKPYRSERDVLQFPVCASGICNAFIGA